MSQSLSRTQVNVKRGSFTVTGTGGLPPTPYEAIALRYAVTNIQSITGSSGNVSSGAKQVETSTAGSDRIQEAQGMTITPEGRTILGTHPQLVATTNAQDIICHP